MTLPFFGSGMVEIPPDGYKRMKNSRKMQMVFFVHEGKVTVDIEDVQFGMTKGGVWQVPRGEFFFLFLSLFPASSPLSVCILSLLLLCILRRNSGQKNLLHRNHASTTLHATFNTHRLMFSNVTLGITCPSLQRTRTDVKIESFCCGTAVHPLDSVPQKKPGEKKPTHSIETPSSPIMAFVVANTLCYIH
jgi:hypothetical protein